MGLVPTNRRMMLLNVLVCIGLPEDLCFQRLGLQDTYWGRESGCPQPSYQNHHCQPKSKMV